MVIPVGLPKKSGIWGTPKITTLQIAPYRHCGGAKIVILGGLKPPPPRVAEYPGPQILVRLTEMSLGGWSQMLKILVRLTEMSFRVPLGRWFETTFLYTNFPCST